MAVAYHSIMVTKYHVRIKGEAPLLMHAPTGLGKGSSTRGVIPSPEEEAKQGLYLDAKGKTVVPARCIEGAIVKAAAGIKAPGKGRQSMKNYVLAGLQVYPMDVPLESEGYEVDVRRAVIQRQGVLRARPRFDEWALDFEIQVIDEYLQSAGMDRKIQDLVSQAGALIGLLDFRPRFGRFTVESFEKV